MTTSPFTPDVLDPIRDWAGRHGLDVTVRPRLHDDPWHGQYTLKGWLVRTATKIHPSRRTIAHILAPGHTPETPPVHMDMLTKATLNDPDAKARVTNTIREAVTSGHAYYHIVHMIKYDRCVVVEPANPDRPVGEPTARNNSQLVGVIVITDPHATVRHPAGVHEIDALVERLYTGESGYSDAITFTHPDCQESLTIAGWYTNPIETNGRFCELDTLAGLIPQAPAINGTEQAYRSLIKARNQYAMVQTEFLCRFAANTATNTFTRIDTAAKTSVGNPDVPLATPEAASVAAAMREQGMTEALSLMQQVTPITPTGFPQDA